MMTLETETASTAAGSNGRNGSDAKITVTLIRANQIQATGEEDAARRLYQKMRSPRTWWKRWTLQPPSIHIIDQKL